MKRGSRILLVLVCMLLSGVSALKAQVLVESVAAIVGNEVIYLSDIENMIIENISPSSRLWATLSYPNQRICKTIIDDKWKISLRNYSNSRTQVARDFR